MSPLQACALQDLLVMCQAGDQRWRPLRSAARFMGGRAKAWGIGLPGIRAPACVVTMRGYVVGEASHWFMMGEGDIGTLMHKCKLLVGVCRRRAAALCDRGGGGAAGGRVHDRRAQLLPGCKATAQGCAGALWRFPKAGCADMCPGCERGKIGHALLLNKP